MYLSKEQILANLVLPSETVDVPEWGGKVRVATMSGTARDEWEQSMINAPASRKMENMRAKLVAATVVNEQGERFFSADDVEALGQLSGSALDRVCRVAQRLNGLTNEDLEDAKGN